MTITPLIEQLEPRTHSCLIYQNADQQTVVTSQFLKIGLGRNERCVFLEMPEKLERTRQALNRLGIDTAKEESRGALIFSAKRDYLAGSRFETQRTIGFLKSSVDAALNDGFAALRATGDLNWELGAEQNFNVLTEYEAQLDQFVQEQKIVGLCQYQRYTMSSTAICNALETHDDVILGTRLCTNNLYYEPPEVKLETDLSRREQKRGEWRCQQLNRSMPLAA